MFRCVHISVELAVPASTGNDVNETKIKHFVLSQDANVRLIRELREEIDRLKNMLLSFEMVPDFNSSN